MLIRVEGVHLHDCDCGETLTFEPCPDCGDAECRLCGLSETWACRCETVDL